MTNGSANYDGALGAPYYRTEVGVYDAKPSDSPLTVIQNGELDRPVGSVHRDFSFTAPSTPGVYRIRMAATWAYEAIQSFYGDGPKGDAWNPGVGDYTEVEIEVD